MPAIAAAALAAVAAAVPLLVPVSTLIPRITAIASEKLGQPVTMEELHLFLLPTPRVVARGIVVGKKREAVVDELEIVPELLLSGPVTIRLVRAEHVALGDAASAIPAGMPKPTEQGEGSAVRVRRIILKDVRLAHPEIRLPAFDFDARVRDDLSIEEARLEASGIDLKLAMAPEGDSGMKVDLDGKLYGGKINVSLRMDHAKQWRISGKATVAGVDLVPLQVLLGKVPKFSGSLKADASFQFRARAPELLAGALSLDAPVEIAGGVYHGYDLSKVGAFQAKLPAGGETRFDALTAKLELRGKRVRIRELCARSPDLVAGGNVEIAPDQQLSGKLDVSVAKTGGFVGIPIALKGTTSEPSFSPTKGFLIGAAVGTVLLPVIGTSIGSSLGSRIEGTSSCK